MCVLVFWQAGLYAQRERRPGLGRIVASLVLLALIVLAFGIGTSYDFTTTGLIPTAVVTCALAIGLLRAAYASLSLELMRVAGVRRRVVLAGDGESVRRLRRELGSSRVGIAYELIGVVSPAGEQSLPVLGTSLDDIPGVLERQRPDELILAESDFDERQVLDVVERAHRQGVRVRLAPDTTDLLVRKGEYVPGTGVPLFELKPPILTGWDWALKRSFDLLVSVLARRRRDAPVASPRPGDQARLARAGVLRRPARGGGRARVRDAQVPDDGPGTPRSSKPGSSRRTKRVERSSRFATTRG